MRAKQLAALSGSLHAEISRELRHDLARIVLRAAALDPELRYGSAAALADDLQRCLDGRPVLATPPSVLYLTRKFIARRKVTSAAMLLAAASMIGGTVAAMYGVRRANESAVHAQVQQQRAEVEAALATEINEFWLDIIRRGSPQEAQRPDLRVREALDLAAPRLTDEVLAPRVRLRLHETFADAYQTLGLREAQLHHARQAWALWEESGDGDLSEMVRLRVALGSALMETHRLDEAKSVLMEVKEVCESGDRLLRPRLPLVLHVLSRVALAEGDVAATESLLLEAIAIAGAELGPRHVLTMTNIKQLSLALVQSGRSQEAAERLEPLLVMQREELGPHHLEVISTMTTLVSARQNLGEFDEAERGYHELLALTPTILGGDHYYVVLLRNNYASLLRELGRHHDAEVLFREVYEARVRMDGAEHPSTLQALVNLTMSLFSQQKFDEGLPLILGAVEARDRVLGREHPDTLNARQVLASVYHRTGRVEEAVQQFAMLLEQYRDALPPGHVRFAPILRNYGLALIDVGRLGDAVPLLIESYEVQLGAAGPDHPQTRRGLEILCRTLDELDERDARDMYAQWRERCAAGM